MAQLCVRRQSCQRSPLQAQDVHRDEQVQLSGSFSPRLITTIPAVFARNSGDTRDRGSRSRRDTWCPVLRSLLGPHQPADRSSARPALPGHPLRRRHAARTRKIDGSSEVSQWSYPTSRAISSNRDASGRRHSCHACPSIWLDVLLRLLTLARPASCKRECATSRPSSVEGGPSWSRSVSPPALRRQPECGQDHLALI
jgi:hypothetical protein